MCLVLTPSTRILYTTRSIALIERDRQTEERQRHGKRRETEERQRYGKRRETEERQRHGKRQKDERAVGGRGGS
jgi:hypothetical protein